MGEVYFNDDLMVALLGYTINNTTCHLFKEDDYFLSLVLSNRSNKTSLSAADNSFTSVPRVPAREWYQYVIPIICIVGIIGNILNLIVLTRRRLLSRMDDLEKSATYGLVALAFSDMMFCLAVFPHSFISINMRPRLVTNPIQIYYQLYGVGLINLSLMSSTWLIVFMAVSRYVVVVYPFHARWTLGGTKTILSIIGVYTSSVCFTLPFFLHMKVSPCSGVTEEETKYYEYHPIWSENTEKSMQFYMRWVWPIFADFIPLLILTCVNIHLIRELRQAMSRRRNSCRGQKVRDSSHRVNLTLVIIVLMLFLCVSPAEILRYINPYDKWGDIGRHVMTFTNVCQTLNFAINFILYCVVSESFRTTVKTVFTSCGRNKPKDDTDNGSPLTEKTNMYNRRSMTKEPKYQKVQVPIPGVNSNGLE